MFQFTTTNVINSNQDLTTGKALWSGQAATSDKPASFQVLRVNKFLAPNVKAIYKAVATDPELAKVTINLGQLNGKKGDQFRLALYIGLTQASQESTYSNDMIFKGKPFTIDFVFGASAADTVKNLVKTINKYEVLVYGYKLLNVSYNGAFLTIEATNEYQRFKKVNLEKFVEGTDYRMDKYEVVRSLEDLTEATSNSALKGTSEGYFVGKEGFGTYPFLLHNLRIPTNMRTRAFAVNADETPVVGAKYNQYTIHYCVNRGILGTNAVGDVVNSLTTHVFYVKSDLATDFETALGNLGTITEVPTKPASADSEEDTE